MARVRYFLIVLKNDDKNLLPNQEIHAIFQIHKQIAKSSLARLQWFETNMNPDKYVTKVLSAVCLLVYHDIIAQFLFIEYSQTLREAF